MDTLTRATTESTQIDRVQLVALLQAYAAQGPCRAILETRTQVRGHEGVVKLARTSVIIGLAAWAPENAARSPLPMDFCLHERSWGERVGACFVQHKGRAYLETIITQRLRERYETANGTTLPKALVQPEGTTGPRDYALESITAVVLDTERYEVAG